MRNLLSLQKTFFILMFLHQIPLYATSHADLSAFKPKQLKKLALRCELMGDTYTALMYMEQSFKKDSTNPKTIYCLAELYRKSRQYDAAIVYYSHSLLDNDKKFPLRKYHLGSLKMTHCEYREAKELLTEFRRMYSGNNSKQYRKVARNLIMGCDSALTNTSLEKLAFIENLGSGVNSEHIEFSPYPISENRILFGTLPLDTVDVFSHSKNNTPKRKLYVAKKSDTGWETIIDDNWNINDSLFNNCNAVLSPDRERLYFTKCAQNWKFQNICSIYKSIRFGNGWSAPEKLGSNINMENYTATHPAIGINPKDGSDILYFVSDRPEGKGGYDIWYSTFDTRRGTFKPAKNLGSKINTFANEITPHYNTSTQSLYFSSNGLPGFGGFDNFRIKGWGRKWEAPSNIGTPANSSYNDLYLALNPDGNSGYFASNRPGSQLLKGNTCCDDIYFFNWKIPVTIQAKGYIYNNSNDELVNTLNNKFNTNIEMVPVGEPLDNVKVMLYRKEDNGNLHLVHSTSTRNGDYNLNLERDQEYEILIKNYGYFDKRISVNTMGYLSDDTLQIRETGIAYVPNIELDFNIYYNPGDDKLSVNDQAMVDSTVVFLLDILPMSIIEIGSHTDNIGGEEYNQKLSQKRAENVSKYLQQNGIQAERLLAKGYGMSEPIALNQFPDGTDNPEGRKQNRRTQIKIIGTLTQNEDVEE